MNKLDSFLKTILSHNLTIIIVGICAMLSIFMAFLEVEATVLRTLLKDVALLNITISIGIGAIAISINKEKETLLFLKEIIIIMLMSILSYFLPFWADESIMRLYLLMLAVSCSTILISIARKIDEMNRGRK